MVLGSVLLLGAGCGTEGGEETRALYELERLAFVPAAEARILGFSDEHADCSLERAIVIDLFEFTREDGRFYGFDRWSEDSPIASEAATPGEAKLRWPLFLNYYEASDLAKARGMRLPTAREWIHVATVGGVQGYPWHRTIPRNGIANTIELGLGRPTAVGTFEGGRTARFGCYDMLGNVWEWVSDVVPGYIDSQLIRSTPSLRRPPMAPQDRDPSTGIPLEASILGGAYDSRLRKVFFESMSSFEPPRLRFYARREPCEPRLPNVGARMCADAEAYLWAKAKEWGSDDDARRRIEDVGKRWAESAGPEVVGQFLDQLAAREAAPPALQWLADGAHP